MRAHSPVCSTLSAFCRTFFAEPILPNAMDPTPAPTRDTPHCEHPLHRLLEVMATLRGPRGCPWDREQSHASLVPFLIEETYELIEAIETGASEAVCDELGDVLLQVIFHARIAEEAGHYSFAEVAQGLAEKLQERHPHVFKADEILPDSKAVREAWHRNKMETRDSALDGIPSSQPALRWATQVSQRAARSGFDWNNTEEILAKLEEEMAEFQEAWGGNNEEENDEPEDKEGAEMEFGDMLFALVQLGRWRKIDPEAALRKATRKFSRRFRHMESHLRARGLHTHHQNADQWWALWDEAKRATDP